MRSKNLKISCDVQNSTMVPEQDNPQIPGQQNSFASGTYHTAANPYGGSAFSGYGGSSMYSPYSYSSMTPYGGYGGGYGGYGYGYNSMMGEHMWQGFLGRTAETLGRFNNLLSMTGMLVDHISNHGKLLYTKGVELHSWYESVKSLSEKHSEWLERLGFQIESSWKSQEDEEVRRRRMLIRRTRTIIILAFVVALFYYARRRKASSRRAQWEAIYGRNAAQSYHP